MMRHKFVKNTFKGAGAAGAINLPQLGLDNASAASNVIEAGILFPLTGGLSIIKNSLSQVTEMAISGKNAAE